MVSDFRKKKLVHVFTVFFDADKSGSIDKKDFEVNEEKISKLRGWKAGDASYTFMKETLQKVWAGLQGSDSNSDGQVSVEEWISAWENYPATSSDWQTTFAKFVFMVEDGSNDNSVDSEEFSKTYAAFGLDKGEAVAAFQKLSGGSSSISWDQFEKLFKEYFSSEDVNAPGNFIFGKTSF